MMVIRATIKSVRGDGTYAILVDGEESIRNGLLARHNDGPPGWTPKEGEEVRVFIDRDEVCHITGSVGSGDEPRRTERRMGLVGATVISAGIIDRWATIREGAAQMVFEGVSVALRPDFAEEWFPQPGDEVLVLIEQMEKCPETRTIVGPMPRGLNTKALDSIAHGLEALDKTINKALDDFRGGRLGGIR